LTLCALLRIKAYRNACVLHSMWYISRHMTMHTTTQQMRQKNACVFFVVCLLVVLIAHVHGAYEIVDTVRCANVLDSLMLDENLIDIKARNVVTYDLSSMPKAETDLFVIRQPIVSFSASNNDMRTDETTDKFASKLVEKYRLAYTTITSPPKWVIGAVVFTEVDFHQATAYDNTALKSAITLAVQKSDLPLVLVKTPSDQLAITIDECSWYTSSLYAQRTLACGVQFNFNTCVYIPFQQQSVSVEHREWITNLLSLMSGMGNLFFKVDYDKTMQSGDLDCEFKKAIAIVRGFPFKLCDNMNIVATCFDKGAPCTKAQSEQNMAKFWDVYSIMQNEDPTQITNTVIEPVLGTLGVFKVSFTKVHMLTHTTAYAAKDKYFKNSIRRPCFLGQIPRKVVVSERGFFHETRCQPCMLNTYYSEQDTPRNAVTEDTTKTKTLFLGLVVNRQDSAVSAYFLAENTGENQHVEPEDPPADFSFAVAGGTTVTIHVDSRMVFEGIRGPVAVQAEAVVDNIGVTTLTITIPNIYGEDADDADAPIFIDVRTKVPRNVTNAKFLAIFPVRHPLLQTCKPCPNDFVTNNYASTGLEACVEFQGARRANVSTILPAIAVRSTQTPPTLLLDSIAGFQLRQVVYTARSSRVQIFIETTPEMAILHRERILLDVARFFGFTAPSNTSFSFGLADLIDINTPPSVLPTTQVRRLLQAITAPGTSEGSLDIVGISMQVNRDPSPLPAPVAADVDIIATTVGIVILVLILACVVTVFITCVYITCKCTQKHTADRPDMENHPFLEQPEM